ncbi:MAG: pentapeptide repeat-containing protein [Alphaproteobacteria bacterium]
MSNVHHLRNVAQGAGRWNTWRKQEPNVQPDLAQADLRGADLAGLDLDKAILSLANLKKADLSGANLKDANLAGANLEEVNLAGANLEGANIAGAYLLRANFSGCNLKRVNLAGAGLVGKVLMAGADLSGANLAGARLVGAKLSGANLTRANLAGADLRDADLSGANLTDAETSGTRFDGADLSGTMLQSSRSRSRSDMAALGAADGDGADDARDMADEEPPPREAVRPKAEIIKPEPEPEPPAVAEAGPSEEDLVAAEAESLIAEAEALMDQDDALADDDSENDFVITDVEPPGAELEPEQEPEESAAVEEEEEAPVVEDAAPEAPPPAPRIVDDETLFFTYETREFAVLSLHLSGLSEKTAEDRHDLLDLLSRYNKYFLDQGSTVYLAARTNAIVAAFDTPTDALRSADRYLFVLKGLNVDAHIGVNWGTATIRRNDAHGLDELIVNSISPAARLEPMANSGEVVVLEEIRTHPKTDKSQFEFARVTRKWKRDVDHEGAGVDVVCYLVTVRGAHA